MPVNIVIVMRWRFMEIGRDQTSHSPPGAQLSLDNTSWQIGDVESFWALPKSSSAPNDIVLQINHKFTLSLLYGVAEIRFWRPGMLRTQRSAFCTELLATYQQEMHC